MEDNLAERLQRLEERCASLESELKHLRDFTYVQFFFNRLFEKAFQVMCFGGDYLEFGVYEGESLVEAYHAAERIFDRLAGPYWDHTFGDPTRKQAFAEAWAGMRFIGFDTFAGMPAVEGVDAQYAVFEEGTFATRLEKCEHRIARSGAERSRFHLVPGLYKETLTPETAQRLGLEKVAVAHIDCDLYSSAREALEFITPYLQDGSIIIFDEWFHYRGNPTLGEQRAFNEWLRAHPELTASEFQNEGPLPQGLHHFDPSVLGSVPTIMPKSGPSRAENDRVAVLRSLLVPRASSSSSAGARSYCSTTPSGMTTGSLSICGWAP
jgi:O-methyltransferase